MRSKFVAIIACFAAMTACAPTIWDKPGANQHSPSSADEAALRSCAVQTCKIVFRVGPRLCGAIATNDDGKVWGGATRPTHDAAAVAAMENCKKRTQSQCRMRGVECNS